MKAFTVVIPNSRADANEVYDRALDYFCYQSHCPNKGTAVTLLTTEEYEDEVKEFCKDFDLQYKTHELN